jgi:uncharacterized protein YggE
MKKLIYLTIFLSAFSVSAFAAESLSYDPLARNLIYVDGQAKVTAQVDSFDIAFDFDVARGSYDEGRKEAEEFAIKTENALKDLQFKQIEVIRGWDLIRQDRISLTSKAKQISNILRIRVVGFPTGKLHESISKVIDRTLAVNGAIGLRSVSVDLSPEAETKANDEALAKAVAALETKAKLVAEGLGSKVVAAKQIFISNNQQAPMARGMLMESYAQASYFKSPVTIQKNFRVDTQVPDSVDIATTVNGVYEIQ